MRRYRRYARYVFGRHGELSLIHKFDAGQFYDLIHLLSLTGSPTEKHALVFNGDFVDRGSWSVEVALTLFAYKCQYCSHRLALC